MSADASMQTRAFQNRLEFAELKSNFANLLFKVYVCLIFCVIATCEIQWLGFFHLLGFPHLLIRVYSFSIKLALAVNVAIMSKNMFACLRVKHREISMQYRQHYSDVHTRLEQHKSVQHRLMSLKFPSAFFHSNNWLSAPSPPPAATPPSPHCTTLYHDAIFNSHNNNISGGGENNFFDQYLMSANNRSQQSITASHSESSLLAMQHHDSQSAFLAPPALNSSEVYWTAANHRAAANSSPDWQRRNSNMSGRDGGGGQYQISTPTTHPPPPHYAAGVGGGMSGAAQMSSSSVGLGGGASEGGAGGGGSSAMSFNEEGSGALVFQEDLSGSVVTQLSADQIWNQYGINEDRLERWTHYFRLWISGTLIKPIIAQCADVNAKLKTHHGGGAASSDFAIGSTNLNVLREFAASWKLQYPTLPILIKFFDLGGAKSQQYLLQRISELSRGQNLASFRWNSGSNNSEKLLWQSWLPNDCDILLHLIAVYIDLRLQPPLLNSFEFKSFAQHHIINHNSASSFAAPPLPSSLPAFSSPSRNVVSAGGGGVGVFSSEFVGVSPSSSNSSLLHHHRHHQSHNNFNYNNNNNNNSGSLVMNDATDLLRNLASSSSSMIPASGGSFGGGDLHGNASHISQRCAIVQTSSNPPHFKVLFFGKLYEVPPGRNNLLHALLLFFYCTNKNNSHATLKWINLGPSGLNFKQIFEK